MRLGLQMWSIFDVVMEKGFAAAMREVRKIGYEGIEFAMHGNPTVSALTGIAPRDLKAMLDDAGIVPIGHHLPEPKVVLDNWSSVVEEIQTLGVPYSGIGPAFYGDRTPFSDQKETYALYANLCGMLRDAGTQPVVHGSAYGFLLDYKGRHVIEGMLEEIGLDLLQPEFDTAWMIIGRVDPVEYIHKYANHVDLLHLKDFHPPIEESDYLMVRHNTVADHGRGTAVGEDGVQDVGQIVRAAGESGVKWLITELWNEPNSMENAAKSLENISRYL